MTLNRLKRRKRRSFYKKLLPTVLAIALVFSTVMSTAFAMWQDDLKIESTVSVAKQPLTYTVSRNNPYTDVDLSSNDYFIPMTVILVTDHSMYNHFMYEEYPRGVFGNWVCYQTNYGPNNGNLLTYQINANWSESSGVFTIYNHELNVESMKRDRYDLAPVRNSSSDGSYGVFAWNLQASDNDSYVGFSGRYPLDKSDYNSYSRNWQYGDGFYGVAGIPIAVTLTNPNSTDVKITSVTFSNSSAASYASLPTIPANGTADLIINPQRVGDNYTSFDIKITDDGGNEYTIPVKIQRISSGGNESTQSFRPASQVINGPTTAPTAPTTTTTAKVTTTTTTKSPEATKGTATTTATTAATTTAATTTTTAPTTAATTTATTTTTAAPTTTTTTTTAAPTTTTTTTTTAAPTTTTTTTTAAPTTTTTTSSEGSGVE